MELTYKFLADLVLSLHVAFVAFVILGLVLIVVGGFLNWSWILISWFRLIHLAGIGVVVVQAWLGIVCPLTTLEMWLREQAGQALYDGSFIQYWLQRLLYYEAPAWVFVVVYTAFALLVFVAWLRFPPRCLRKVSRARA